MTNDDSRGPLPSNITDGATGDCDIKEGSINNTLPQQASMISIVNGKLSLAVPSHSTPYFKSSTLNETER